MIEIVLFVFCCQIYANIFLLKFFTLAYCYYRIIDYCMLGLVNRSSFLLLRLAENDGKLLNLS